MAALTDILIDPPAEGAVVDPQSWFATSGPFELEIGCGKGGFLLSRARARPEIRILGIEMKNKHCLYCADRLNRWQVENARVMRVDARQLVLRHLPPRCVSILHLYHPDPWPKKRHHKRRLVQPDFAEAAARVLAPGGCWLVQSDHEEYFNQIVSVLDARPEFTTVAWESAGAEPGPEWSGTNFEVKFSSRGHPILKTAVRRTPDAR